jgi:hypothetical protein
MTKIEKCGRAATAIGLLLATSVSAGAKQEALSGSLRYLKQVSALTCEDFNEGWQNEVCAGAEMRLRLCEKGLIAEAALSPGVYQCFLRSQ